MVSCRNTCFSHGVSLSEKSAGVLIGFVALAIALNYLSAWWFDWPFLLCAANWATTTSLFGAIRLMLIAFFCCALCYYLIKGNYGGAISIGIIMVVVYLLPQLFLTMASVGGSCG